MRKIDQINKKHILEPKGICGNKQRQLKKPVSITRGVRQGCVFSPLLFNWYNERIFRKLREKPGINIGGHVINNLRYADDTVLLATSKEDIQDILETVNREGEKYGMRMNIEKTKSMILSRSDENRQMNLKLKGESIDQVDRFTYLGQLLVSDGKSDDVIKRRIEIARGAFRSMSNTLNSRDLSIKIRKRLVNRYIWSTLLYGAETWTISKNMMDRIRAFEMWVWWKIQRISWQSHMKNDTVLERIGEKRNIMQLIMSRKHHKEEKLTSCHIGRSNTIKATQRKTKIYVDG